MLTLRETMDRQRDLLKHVQKEADDKTQEIDSVSRRRRYTSCFRCSRRFRIISCVRCYCQSIGSFRWNSHGNESAPSLRVRRRAVEPIKSFQNAIDGTLLKLTNCLTLVGECERKTGSVGCLKIWTERSSFCCPAVIDFFVSSFVCRR